MTEKAMLFGRRRSLAGVLTVPNPAHPGDSRTAVILLNAGMIHHVGPGRLYVKLARALADEGVTSARVDFSGVGDSPARTDNLPVIEAAVKEPREVMDSLTGLGFQQFILIGLCSGAYCAYLTALEDSRVTGVVLINTMSLDGELEMDQRVWKQRYLGRSIYSLQAWKNLLTGKVDYARLVNTFFGSKRYRGKGPADDDSQVLVKVKQLIQHNQLLHFIFSANDKAINYLEVVLGRELDSLLADNKLKVTVVPEADHLFSRHGDQRVLIRQVCDWIAGVRSASANEIAS